MDEDTLLAVFDGVPRFDVSRDEISAGIKAIDLFTEKAAIFNSKGELRKPIQSGGVSLNKEKIEFVDAVVTADSLLDGKYLLVQRGKKNYFLLTAKEFSAHSHGEMKILITFSRIENTDCPNGVMVAPQFWFCLKRFESSWDNNT